MNGYRYSLDGVTRYIIGTVTGSVRVVTAAIQVVESETGTPLYLGAIAPVHGHYEVVRTELYDSIHDAIRATAGWLSDARATRDLRDI